MDFVKIMDSAVENNEIIKLLCGEKPYEVEVSKFTSDVFPTDINSVLMNCIYKRKNDIDDLEGKFINSLYEMIQKDATSFYIAVLYFDTCIFQEEKGNATFTINKEEFAKNIKANVDKYLNVLSNEIQFFNGMTKRYPIKTIENFNRYYEKKYSFSIL